MSDDEATKHLSLKERIWRWAGSSGTATIVQILLALLFSFTTMSVFWAGALAYALSGLVGFFLHTVYTWRDRHRNLTGQELAVSVAKRFAKFELVSLSAATINGFIQLTFTTEVIDTRPLAWLVANAVTAPYFFLMLNKVVFRHEEPPTDLVERDE